MAGRFIVKVFYGAGNSVPFTGVSDSSGYFYIPTIPAGQPFETIAVDTVTKTTRSVKGVGPEVGRSTYLFFDFTSPGSSGGKLVDYDTNTQGVYGGVDVHLFQGKAGDIVNLAIFSEQSPLAGFHFQLNDANGVPLISGATSGGYYFETKFIELKADGLYTFTVDGSAVSGNYTLGLAKIDPPQPLDLTVPLVGNLATLGDSQFYTFTGNVNDLLQATLSHDGGSTLNADLLVREPRSSVPFYEQPVVLPSLDERCAAERLGLAYPERCRPLRAPSPAHRQSLRGRVSEVPRSLPGRSHQDALTTPTASPMASRCAALGLLACLGGCSVLPAAQRLENAAATVSSPIAMSPDGRTVWVVNPDADSVTPIDAGSLKAGPPLAVGREPWGVAATASGLVVVLNRADGTVSLLEGRSRTTIPVGPEPGGFVLARSGSAAYVTVSGSDEVVTVDLRGGLLRSASRWGASLGPLRRLRGATPKRSSSRIAWPGCGPAARKAPMTARKDG